MRTSNDSYNQVFVLNNLCISRLQRRHSKIPMQPKFSFKHFNKHLECNDIQNIIINFPNHQDSCLTVSNYHIQQKLSLQLQSWNNIRIFSHKHINKPTHLMHNSSQIHKHIQCCQQPKRVNKNLQIQALDSEIPLKLAQNRRK